MTRATYTQPEIDRIRRLTETHGPTTAARIVGTCTETIANMRRRGWRPGKKGIALRSLPSDFVIQSAHLTIHQLVEHYGSSINTVLRWAETIARPKLVGRRFEALPIPADLDEVVAQRTSAEAARHYGVHPQTARKWMRQRAAADAAGRDRGQVGWAERLGAGS